jgi:thiosulfate/3-mercaptopyruvate sulfurtransferase
VSVKKNFTIWAVALAFTLAGCAATVAAAHPEIIVTPAWVNAVRQFHRQEIFQRPATYHNQRYVILETSWGKLSEAKAYRAGHVPGALHLNTDELENGYPRWHLKPLPALQRVIGRLGITRATTVIVYSHQTIAAARVWWVLSYAGVSDVRVLDGGFAAWQAAGFAGETKINEPRAVTFTATPRADWQATTEYVRERFAQRNVWLADARSRAEYRGEVSGYSYLLLRGRIPGALAIGDADDKAQLYQTAEGRLLPPAEIAARWRQAGLTATGSHYDREVIFYCGSGWRSSLTFLYAYVLGYENIRNYSEGWSAWSTTYKRDPAVKGITPGWRQEASRNPIAIGDE